jgi:hypothetical protein
LSEAAGVRPHFAAVEGTTEGEIAIEADREARLARPLCRSCELPLGRPLQPGAKADGAAVRLCEALEIISGRPIPAVARAVLLGQGLEHSVQLEIAAARFLESREIGACSRCEEVGEGALEERLLLVPYAGIVHIS